MAPKKKMHDVPELQIDNRDTWQEKNKSRNPQKTDTL
jgi:hypothetical protein